MIGVVDLDFWEELRPYAYLQSYSKQRLKDGTDRKRRVITRDIPKELRTKVDRAVINCCACGKLINPFRESFGFIQIATTCRQEENNTCCRKMKLGGNRKKLSSIECERIENSINGRKFPLDPKQEDLF